MTGLLRECYNGLMARPERYQMGFDFKRSPEHSLFYYELGFAGTDKPEGAGRFVRHLREEVVIRTPEDAGHHLLTHIFSPFEAFDQEELWCLLLNTKNRIVRRLTAGKDWLHRSPEEDVRKPPNRPQLTARETEQQTEHLRKAG